ncbi:MAG: hypothetical protein GEV06_23470 [Luteitalea sp.]|nr:hypothetical protein [Luteitalea sp.]
MSAIPETTTTWNIDRSHASLEFSVRHLMIATVKGRLSDVSGRVLSDDSDLTTARVEVTVGVNSIDTREAQRDAHLRSADFFDVEKYPTLTFRSTRVTDVSNGTFKLVGDLTIHGVTREVGLDVTAEGRGKDPWGNERAGFSATTKIKRSDFGLVWNQVLETGGVAVGDEVKIAIDLELVRQA